VKDFQNNEVSKKSNSDREESGGFEISQICLTWEIKGRVYRCEIKKGIQKSSRTVLSNTLVVFQKLRG
jgi:hypothetical protein